MENNTYDINKEFDRIKELRRINDDLNKNWLEIGFYINEKHKKMMMNYKTYKIKIANSEFTQQGVDIQNAFNSFFNNTLELRSSIKSLSIQEWSEQDEMLDKLKSLQAEMTMIRVKLGMADKVLDVKLGRTPDDGC